MRTVVHKLLLVTAMSAALAGCNNQPQPAAEPDGLVVPIPITDSKVVATVNGRNITEAELMAFIDAQGQVRPGQTVTPDQALPEFIRMEVVRQAAEAESNFSDPAVAAQINFSVTQAIVQNWAQNKIENEEPSEEAIQAEYQKRIADIPTEEYKTSHILLETEEAAQEVIQQLNDGADFAELAKEKSTGPSGPNGGELGWTDGTAFVPEFTAGLTALENGEYSKEPVQTQFGYHVILLEDTREKEQSSQPSIEQVRPQIRQMLIAENIRSTVEQLENSATITQEDLSTATAEAEAAAQAPTAQPAPAQPATTTDTPTPATETTPAADSEDDNGALRQPGGAPAPSAVE